MIPEDLKLELDKAMNLIYDCMEMNDIKVDVALIVFQTIFATALRNIGSYEDYCRALDLAKKSHKPMWDE
jgi:hypothetical protein